MSFGLEHKKVQFSLKDERYNYNYPNSTPDSEVEDIETGSDSESQGPTTPPSPLYLLPFDHFNRKSDDEILFNTKLTNPAMPWDTFKEPTTDAIPWLVSSGKERALISKPQGLTTLTLVHHFLPRWPIKVDLRNTESLTVEDFYAVIYRHLYQELPRPGVEPHGVAEQMRESHSQRCKEQQLNEEEEPIRVIDSTRLHRLFCGIRAVAGDGTVELIFLPIQ